jgi:hypothetical protein
VYEGIISKKLKLKLKSQTTKILHQKNLEKKPHQPSWEKGKVKKEIIKLIASASFGAYKGRNK